MKASDIERDDIKQALEIKMQPFTEMGLQPNDPLVIKHITDYFMAILALLDKEQ